jgi:hypothetical protein
LPQKAGFFRLNASGMSSKILPTQGNGQTPDLKSSGEANADPTAAASALLTSEVLLPEQFYPPLAVRFTSPEQRLMLAVLEDAVYTILKYAGKPGRNPRRLVREAEAWIARSEPSWPFSYENICAVLGIDADALRARLRRYQLEGERTGSTGAAALANQHRVVGRQHKVVLAPAIRRRLRAQKARLAEIQQLLARQAGSR